MDASLGSFLAASVLLTLMPGPDNLFVITQSMVYGARRGLLITLGLISGIVVHTSLAATGLALVIEQRPDLYALLRYLGAAYLLFLAYQAYRHRQDAPVRLQAEHPRPSGWKRGRWWLRGFVMNVLNPKVTLFFLAFLPRFVPPDSPAPTAHFFLLGALFMGQGLLLFSLFALLAGRLARWLQRPRHQFLLRWLEMAVLALLALSLILLP
jgi:threonine/homoserine/homoserine lactone efflux protein